MVIAPTTSALRISETYVTAGLLFRHMPSGGQICAATATGPYPAWMGGWAPSTQATACACVPVPPPPGGIAPPGSGSTTAPTAPDDVAPVTGGSTTERLR